MTAKLAMCQIGQLSDLEKFALTRDGMVRDDADALLYGFFPAWGVVLFLLGGEISQLNQSILYTFILNKAFSLFSLFCLE